MSDATTVPLTSSTRSVPSVMGAPTATVPLSEVAGGTTTDVPLDEGLPPQAASRLRHRALSVRPAPGWKGFMELLEAATHPRAVLRDRAITSPGLRSDGAPLEASCRLRPEARDFCTQPRIRADK